MANGKKVPKKKVRKQPNWKLTPKRREALEKAQKTHQILVAIGKEYRNKAIRKAKYKKLIKGE